MRVDRSDLAKKINQLKGIVPKTTTVDALKGILCENGYLIASNNELTVKAKLEGMGDDNFIIPVKAFDLINNLPDGEVDITCQEDEKLIIKMGNIKNQLKTHGASKFIYSRESIETTGEALLVAEELIEAISHVIYAIPDKDISAVMGGMYFECLDSNLNLVGLDGKRMAWDIVQYTGDFKLIIPKVALEKVMQLNMHGDLSFSYDKSSAVFKTDEYEIYTRLIEGEYFNYRHMITMLSDENIKTVVDRRALLEAMNRVRLCEDSNDKVPVVLNLSENTIHINYKNSTSNYIEEVAVKEKFCKELKIAFNPKFIIESLKSFDCTNVIMLFDSKRTPVHIKAEDCDMTSLVVPVNFVEV